jgi:hypothetical protein
MSSIARLALAEDVRGLRLHDPKPAAGVARSPRLARLLDVRERSERERQQHAALVQTLGAIGAALERLPRQVAESLRGVEAIAVELGLTVAREVVGSCLERGLVDPAPIVARCLRAAVAGVETATLVIALHPSDLPLVLNAVESDPELRSAASGCSFEPDPRLARGAVRVGSEAGRMLYDPREVLERIADEVRKESSR